MTDTTGHPAIAIEIVTVDEDGIEVAYPWEQSHHISVIKRELNRHRRAGYTAWVRVNGRDIADSDIGEAILMAADEVEQNRCG